MEEKSDHFQRPRGHNILAKLPSFQQVATLFECSILLPLSHLATTPLCCSCASMPCHGRNPLFDGPARILDTITWQATEVREEEGWKSGQAGHSRRDTLVAERSVLTIRRIGTATLWWSLLGRRNYETVQRDVIAPESPGPERVEIVFLPRRERQS